VVYDPYEYIHLNDLITPEENSLRLKIKEFVDKEIKPTINDYVETATFPGPIV
jgi:acyl-CoA oxidase